MAYTGLILFLGENVSISVISVIPSLSNLISEAIPLAFTGIISIMDLTFISMSRMSCSFGLPINFQQTLEFNGLPSLYRKAESRLFQRKIKVFLAMLPRKYSLQPTCRFLYRMQNSLIRSLVLCRILNLKINLNFIKFL